MKVNTVGSNNRSLQQELIKNSQNPNFKGAMSLDAIGNVMQGIERTGYLGSFLIQDGLGMTLPRVATGFNRDKEITGEWNIQEGLEVLGREGLTGPFMIAVAPAVLWFTGKFCKSTNTNTRLIKRFGESLKEFVKNPELDKTVKNDKNKFRKEFFKYNLKNIYNASVPNDKQSEATIKYLEEQFAQLDSKRKVVSEFALNNIVEKINNKVIENSDNLYNVNKVFVGEGETKAAFNTKAVITALRDFGNDAIYNNKDFEKIDEAAAENIKNNFASKRLFTNIANVVLTLGGLSILPKLYTRGDVAPGAKVLEQARKHQEDNNAENPTFKGKGINSENWLSKLGKLITKKMPEKWQDLFEYSGVNFSKTTFASLSLFGLLLPRGLKAWSRAQVDENGKKDKTEVNEILVRDTISSLSVVFAVPLLTKAIVNSYENNRGFILTNKASDGKNWAKKFLDIINPYSKLEVLSLEDLDTIYGNIDSKAKLLNFSKFIDEKGGDLSKILAKSDNAKLVFNDKSFTLDSIKELSKKEKNKKIISLFEKIDSPSLNAKNEVISKLMKGSGDISKNKIAKFARGLNSLPGAISTFIISPILLGVLIPMLTYHNTRKAQAKKLEVANAQV